MHIVWSDCKPGIRLMVSTAALRRELHLQVGFFAALKKLLGYLRLC